MVATFTAFFDVAAGLGGVLMGLAATAGGYRAAFATVAVCALGALAVLRLVVLSPERIASAGDGPVVRSATLHQEP